jgi:hypothetical protein
MKSLIIAAALCLVANFAFAEVRDLAVDIRLQGDNVSISSLPNQDPAEIVEVVMFDEPGKVAPQKISQNSFKLSKGQGFNFTWRYANDEKIYWQKIAPDSEVPYGLKVDCQDKGGCKYIRQ